MIERVQKVGITCSFGSNNSLYYRSFEVKGLEKNTLQLSRVFLSIHKTIFVEQR